MGEQLQTKREGALDNALRLIEEALGLCDALGYTFAAIDLSAAAEKLIAIRAEGERTD